MLKRLFLLAMVGCLGMPMAQACDACGGSISGGGMGLLAPLRNNAIGLSWQYASFQTAPAQGQGSIDQFHSVELSARYYFTDRFSVQLFQPYRFNLREVEEERSNLSGIGDTRIIGTYNLFRQQDLGSGIQLFAELGAGVKLPVGEYDPDIHDANLPENFNLGNGSWGFILQPNLVFTKGAWGLLLNGSYQHFLPTRTDYQFGHQLSGQLSVFWEKSTAKGYRFIPNLGLQQEHIWADAYANDRTVSGTGGTGTFASLGINIRKGQVLGGVNYAIPIIQEYSQGEVEAQQRLAIQFSYLF